MTTFMIIGLLILAAVAMLLMMTVKVLWSSKLFWTALFIASILLMPVTAGMSPLAVFAAIIIRLLLLSMIFEKQLPIRK